MEIISPFFKITFTIAILGICVNILARNLKQNNMRQLKVTKSMTNRESASLDKYLQEIGKENLITADEEVELAYRIKKGDKSALEKLTKANLRFVVSVSKQYQNQGLSLPDLINEGNLGLIKAAQRFDETRGFKFISYAVWWIRQSILEALAQQSRIVRLPLDRVGFLNKVNKTTESFKQIHHRNPVPEEIAEMLEDSVDKVKEVLCFSTRSFSIDQPFREDEEGNLLDVIVNNNSPSPDHLSIKSSLMKDLSSSFLLVKKQRDAEMVKLRFGIGCRELSYGEIAERFNMENDSVKVIVDRTVRYLRKVSGDTLRVYL